MSEILLSGATGFIGSHLAALLKEKGLKFIAPTRSNSLEYPYIKCDLTKIEELSRFENLFQKVNTLIHIAASIPRPFQSLREAREGALSDLVMVFNLSNFLGPSLKDCIYISTLDVYAHPVYLPVDEEHPTAPETYYGIAKLAAEMLFRAFAKEKNLRLCILRPSTVYGPGEKPLKALPIFIENVLKGQRPIIFGDGGDVRDYIYVGDVVEAIFEALLNKAAGIYNVASGEGHSIREIFGLICDIAGKKVEPIFDARRKPLTKIILDTKKAKRDFGFSASIPLEEGIAKEIEWAKRSRCNGSPKDHRCNTSV